MTDRLKLPPQKVKPTDPAYRSYLQKNANTLYNLNDYINDYTISGTNNQIDVSNGTILEGNTTITISDNPVIPGENSMTIPKGFTEDRPSANVSGRFRYNKNNNLPEISNGTSWIIYYDWTSTDANFSTTGTLDCGAITSTGNFSNTGYTLTTWNITCRNINCSGYNISSVGNLSCSSITVFGTVDGRDVSVDGAKLDGIESGADVTDSTNVVSSIANQNINPDQILVGSATGGFKGSGTINCSSLYDDNTLVFDKVFYDDYKYLPLDDLEEYINKNKHLPTIPGLKEQEIKKPSVGELCNYFYETIEVQALYIIELKNEIEKLKESIRNVAIS